MTPYWLGFGAVVFAAGALEYQLARVHLFDRWQTVDPKEWSRAFKGARRKFPFSSVIRWLIVDERLNAWRVSTPEWIRGDEVALRLLRHLRRGPWIAMAGFAIFLGTLMVAGA